MKLALQNLSSIICCFFIGAFAYAQDPVFAWAKSMGTEGFNEGAKVIKDKSGNVLTAGYFEGVGDFDPGPGVYNLTSVISSGTTRNLFISKLDANGNFVWAKSIANTNYAGITSFVADDNGNVYLTGYFVGSADFDPGPAVYNMVSYDYKDNFILKLNADGNFVWAKQIGGVGNSTSLLPLTLGKSSIYLAGSFTGTFDVDPGPGIVNFTASVFFDIFIEKLDTAGNFISAKHIEGNPQITAQTILLDSLENMYVTGQFLGTTDFDPGPAVYNLNSNAGGTAAGMFMLKLDSAYDFMWAGTIEIHLGAITTIDKGGNLYLTGMTIGTSDFDPGPNVYNLTSSGGSYDIFMSRINPDGTLAWAKIIGNTGVDEGKDIAVDFLGNIYCTGFFTGTVDFDPGPGVNNLTSTGTYDMFISKMDSSGNMLWVKKIANGSAGGYGILVDNSFNIFITGGYTNSGDFDPGPGVFTLSTGSITIEDAFVLKLAQPDILPLNLLDFTAKAIAPREVQLHWLTSGENNTDQFIIERNVGQNNFLSIGTVKAAADYSGSGDYYFNDKDPGLGINFYRLKMIDKDGAFSYSKIAAVKISDEKQVYVFPNPATDVLYINLPLKNETIFLKIVDAAGKLMYKQTIVPGDQSLFSLNIQSFAAGMYNLILQTDNSRQVVTFLKR